MKRYPHISLLNNEVFNDPGKQSKTDDEDEISVKSLVICAWWRYLYCMHNDYNM